MKYSAESYVGRNLGRTGFMCRAGVQIVAKDEDGKRKHVFPCGRNTSPCLKIWEGAWHYKSGFNKQQQGQFTAAMKDAVKTAAKWNESGEYNEDDI